METYVLVVKGKEIHAPELSYEDVEDLIVDWRVGGVTDPLGQLVDWLWSNIQDLLHTISNSITSAINSAVSSITSAVESVIDQVESVITGAIDALQSALIGAISSLSDAVTGAINTLGSTISTVLESLQEVANTIVGTVSNVISAIGDVINSAVSSIIQSINGMLNSLMNAIGSVVSAISGIVATIANTINSAISSLTSAISGIVSSIVSAISGLAGQIVSAISSLASSISSSISSAFQQISSALSTMASTVVSAINSLADSISGIVSQIREAFSDVVSAISGIVDEIVSSVNRVMEEVLNAIKSGFSDLASSFQDAFSGIYTFFGSVFEKITANLVQLGQYFTGFINAISDVGGKIWKVLSDIGASLGNLAKWIADGLTAAWDSLVKALEPLWKPVSEFFDWAYKSLSDFFTKTLPEFFTKTIPEFIDNVIKFFTGDVPAFFSSLWSGLVEFTRPVWEPIKNFLDWIYSSLADFFTKTLPEFFTKTLPDFIDRVVKFFTGDVPAFFSSLWSGFVEFTRPVWEPIKNFLDSVWEGLQEFIKDPFGAITKALSEAGEAITSALEPVIKPISDALAGMSDTLIKAGEEIYKFFTEGIPKFFTDTLPQVMHDMWKWIVEGIMDLGDTVMSFLRFLGEMFGKAVMALRGVLSPVSRPLFQELLGEAVKAGKEAMTPFSPPKEVEDLAKLFIESQKKMMQTLKAGLKKGSPAKLISLDHILQVAIAAGVLFGSLEVAGAVADFLHPIKNMQVRKLVKSMGDKFGMFFITSAPAAAMTFFILHAALRRIYYKAFPVVLPGPEQLTRMWIRNVITEADLDDALAELGYDKPLREGFKEISMSLLTPRQIVQALSRKYIELQDAYFELRRHGYMSRDGIDRPTMVLELSRPFPTVNDLIEFWRLGKVDDKKLREYITWHGYREEFIDAYYTTRLRMPSVSEMITAVVKEAMTPTAFKELLKRQGLVELDKYESELNVPGIAPPGIATVEETLGKPRGKLTWADVLWEAHWRLPPLERIIEFANRAVVGMIHVGGKAVKFDEKAAMKAVLLYSRLHDYKPVPRKHTVLVGGKPETISMPVSDAEIMEAMRFRVLTRIESRFVRRWGLISEEDFMRLLVAQGVSPYVKIKTLDGEEISMLEALMRAEFLQDLLEERTFFRSAVIEAFRKGYNIEVEVLDPISKKSVKVETLKFEEALKAVKFRPEEISWLKASAHIRRTIELRDDAVKSLVNDYVAGMAPVEKLQESLRDVIDDEEVRNSVIEYAIKRRVLARYKRMANRLDREMLREADTILKLYEQGFAPRTEAEKKLDELVEKELLLKEEKEVLLSISDARRQRELRELAIRALAKRLSRGEITPEQFISSATKIGVDKEFVEALMEVYSTAHMLSVGQIISYADEVPIPQDFLEKKLKLLRVPEDEAKIIKEVVKRRPLRDDIASLISRFTTLASTFDVTPEDAGFLRELGLTPKEIQIRRKIIEMLNRKALRHRITRALEVMLREQYQAMAKGQDPGLITLDQFYKVMEKLGYPKEYAVARAQEIIASAAQKKVPEFEALKRQIEIGGVSA